MSTYLKIQIRNNDHFNRQGKKRLKWKKKIILKVIETENVIKAKEKLRWDWFA